MKARGFVSPPCSFCFMAQTLNIGCLAQPLRLFQAASILILIINKYLCIIIRQDKSTIKAAVVVVVVAVTD